MSKPDEIVRKSKFHNLGVDPMQRLASFRPPRDYTLGATKAKKVFTPNLNISRNKRIKPIEEPAKENAERNDNGKKERKRDQNLNNKSRPKIIISNGIFSEGFQDVSNGSWHASHQKLQAQDTQTPTTETPTLPVEDVPKIKQEEPKIHAVTRQENVEAEPENFKPSLENDAPIKLPLDSVAEEGGKPTIKKEFIDGTDVLELLKKNQPTLMLLKLPESLPGREGGGEGRSQRNPQQEASSSAGSGGTQRDLAQMGAKCTLNNMEEGRIGKLQVRRSGRMTLLLGETSFEVSLSPMSGYHQQVVSVSADPATRSASVIELGELCHRMSVFPNWDGLLNKAPA